MTSKSWLVTLAPFVLALATMIKAITSGEALTENETTVINGLVTMFIASGAIGGAISVFKK